MAEPVIAAQFLRHVANCLELTGRSAAGLLADLGLDRDAIEGADTEIPLKLFLVFFERAAALSRNPSFGLHAGRLVGSDSIGPLSFLFLSAPDLGTAFASFTRYLDTMQQASRNRFDVAHNLATFEYQVVDPALPFRRQDAEYSISAMFSLARQYTGGTIELAEVRFEHQRAGPYAVYRDHFGCDVFFEQDTNLLVFPAGHLAHRGRVLSPVLHPIMEDHLRRRAGTAGGAGLIDRVRAAIAQAPLDRPPQVAAVARALGLSAPTLHRRLRAAGTGWRALLDDHRMVAAERMLRETSRSVADIALAVGYAENASFARAFSRHFGYSPRACRV
ncbi:AraC family transcriptional regulator [Novosphingobium sp.]|uniref:AraC family transcriptional regulator n=1 Tax=Novosphingobium sp. TaxID=1874826 RepID=UPI0033402C2D